MGHYIAHGYRNMNCNATLNLDILGLVPRQDRHRRARLASIADDLHEHTKALRQAANLVQNHWLELPRDQYEYLRDWPANLSAHHDSMVNSRGLVGWLKLVFFTLSISELYSEMFANADAAVRLQTLIEMRIREDDARGAVAMSAVRDPAFQESVRLGKEAFKAERFEIMNVEEAVQRSA